MVVLVVEPAPERRAEEKVRERAQRSITPLRPDSRSRPLAARRSSDSASGREAGQVSVSSGGNMRAPFLSSGGSGRVLPPGGYRSSAPRVSWRLAADCFPQQADNVIDIGGRWEAVLDYGAAIVVDVDNHGQVVAGQPDVQHHVVPVAEHVGALHRPVNRRLVKPGEPVWHLVRAGLECLPCPGTAELIRSEHGESGEQSRGLRELDISERPYEFRQRDRWLPAGALERVLRPRIEGGDQGLTYARKSSGSPVASFRRTSVIRSPGSRRRVCCFEFPVFRCPRRPVFAMTATYLTWPQRSESRSPAR